MGGQWWIGASDAASEGKWEWVSGHPWEYTSWGENQPDNAGQNEDCAHFWGNHINLNSRYNKWNDLPCDKTYHATSALRPLCQWPKNYGTKKEISPFV